MRQRLRDYVYPAIGHQPIALVNHDIICEVLDRPGPSPDSRTFCVRSPTVADMVRRLLADIVNFSSAKGYRHRDLANPAAWDRLHICTQRSRRSTPSSTMRPSNRRTRRR